MLHCDRLDLQLGYTLAKLKLSDIVCCEPVQPSVQQKAQLIQLGQVIPLTALQNGTGKYTLLSEDILYATMVEMYQQDQEADCIVIRAHSDAVCNLLIEYHHLELGCDNPDEHKLHIVDLLLELAACGEIKRSSVLSITSELFRQSKRYARMYITIASSGIPELRAAVITPSSGVHGRNAHIPVQRAAQIANLSPEKQSAELKLLQVI